MASRGLYICFLYYVVLEGAARKWLLPAVANELFILKDVLLFGALLWLYVAERKWLRVYRPLQFTPYESTMWQLWLTVAFIGLFVSGFSITGVIGLRYYLAALPILLMHAVLARDLPELRRFFSGYLLLALAVCALGLVQFASEQDAFINRYSWSPASEMDVATFGELSARMDASFVRITGTFSYISPYAVYLQFMFFVALGMILLSGTEKGRLFYAVVAIALLANLFMTGSRGPVAVCLLLSLAFAPFLKRTLGMRFGFMGIALAIVALGVGIWIGRDVVNALIERNEVAGDAVERLAGALFLPIYTVMSDAPFWGDGLGATFLGLGQLTGRGGFEYRFDEIFQDRIAVEVGVLGYAFFIVLKLYFLVATWRLVRRSGVAEIRIWALVCFCYQASLIWSIPIYSAVANTFYMFSIALFVWLRGLEASSMARAEKRLVPQQSPA